MSINAHVENVIYLFIENGFGQPKGGDLAEHKTAAFFQLVEKMKLIAERCQISGNRQGSRSGTDEGDLFSVRLETALAA